MRIGASEYFFTYPDYRHVHIGALLATCNWNMILLY